jgi:hypothetical protein
MKFPILFLPTLLEIALVVALHAQTSTVSPLTPAQREAEIRELRAELKSIAARLDILEAQGREFLPRGMNATPDAPAAPASDTPGVLVHAQTTATRGLVYWWGTKQSTW